MTIPVSDHAILRFLQHAGGFEIERLRQSIQGELASAAAVADQLGQTHFTVRLDGLLYVIAGGVCVTVIEPEPDRHYIVRQERAR